MPSDFLNIYGDIYVPPTLELSKKASDKRQLLKKLAEMEKHITNCYFTLHRPVLELLRGMRVEIEDLRRQVGDVGNVKFEIVQLRNEMREVKDEMGFGNARDG